MNYVAKWQHFDFAQVRSEITSESFSSTIKQTNCCCYDNSEKGDIEIWILVNQSVRVGGQWLRCVKRWESRSRLDWTSFGPFLTSSPRLSAHVSTWSQGCSEVKKGGNITPGAKSLGGADKSQQLRKHFLEYRILLLKDLRFEHWGQTCFLHRSPSNLRTVLRRIKCT